MNWSYFIKRSLLKVYTCLFLGSVFRNDHVIGTNKNIIMSSFKSSRNIQKKEYGPDRSVSDNQSSSVTLNELAVKAIIINCNFEFQQRSHTMIDINLNGVQITKTV